MIINLNEVLWIYYSIKYLQPKDPKSSCPTYMKSAAQSVASKYSFECYFQKRPGNKSGLILTKWLIKYFGKEFSLFSQYHTQLERFSYLVANTKY